MSLRKSGNGRPTGTDGSDFSYRMVVDSRYQKVAQYKSSLSALIFTQAFIQFLAAGILYFSTSKGGDIDRLDVSSIVCCFVSLLLGELGRKRSKTSLLKLFLYGSSTAVLISVVCLLKSENSFQILKDISRWQTSSFELCKIAAVTIGVLVQMFTIGVTNSLLYNMAPPKRSS